MLNLKNVRGELPRSETAYYWSSIVWENSDIHFVAIIAINVSILDLPDIKKENIDFIEFIPI